MHVLMDGIHIQSRMKGVGRYTLNTAQHLVAMDASLRISLLLPEGGPSDGLPGNPRLTPIRVRWQNHLWHGFRTLPRWVRRLRPDVVYIPYETPVGDMKRPYAMVCHDIPQKIREAQQRDKRHFGKIKGDLSGFVDEIFVGKSLRRADVVYGNSRYVVGWLKGTVGVLSSRLYYAPCAPGVDFLAMSRDVDVRTTRERLNSPEGYMLVFFTGDLRENFDVVPHVYEKIMKKGWAVSLVIAGVAGEAREFVESALSQMPWRERVRILPFLEWGRERELAELYTAASVYLDASLHEGFGMQVIEAMACGTPVVCSNRGALPEVAGDAALLVDPEDTAALTSAVDRILSDERLREDLRAKGYEHSAVFSWERTAQVIYQGLEKAVTEFRS
jgi:glycosyltransferase involved in cell wall biosynthesis